MIIEFLYGTLVLMGLAGFLVAGSNHLLLKMRAHAVSQLGSSLMAQPSLPENIVLNEMRDYKNRFSDPFFTQFYFTKGRFRETSASRFYHLVYAQTQLVIKHTFLEKIGWSQFLRSEERVVLEK